MRMLALEFWTSYVTPDGETRQFKDPESPATYRQLSKLNRAGCLVIVEPGDAPPINKGEAAIAVSVVGERGPDDLPRDWSFG